MLNKMFHESVLIKCRRNGRDGYLSDDGKWIPRITGGDGTDVADPPEVTIELPEDLSTLSAEQLSALTGQVDAEITRLSEIADDDLTVEDIDALDQAVAQRDLLDGETTRREEERADRANRRTELLARAGRVVASDQEGDGDGEGNAPDGDENSEGEGEGENAGETPDAEATPPEVAEPPKQKIAASSSKGGGLSLALANKAAAKRPPARRPAPAAPAEPLHMYELAGRQFSNAEEFVSRMAEHIARNGAALSRANGGVGTTFASMTTRTPEALTLRGVDMVEDNRKWNKAWNHRTYVGPHEDRLRSLTASTNFDPGEVISDPLWKASRGHTRSPIAESLPTFNVPKGKATIRRDWMWHRGAPSSGSIGYRTAAEMAAAVDSDPNNDPTPKPIARINMSYRAWFEVKAIAQTQRLLMSNYTDLTDPDGVRQYLQEIAPMEMIIEMETLFLTRIKGMLKTATVAAGERLMGAATSWLEQTWRAVANDRSYHRYDTDQRYTIAAPERLLDIINRDLLIGPKGLERIAGLVGATTSAEALLNRWGQLHGIDWVFYADDISGMSHVATAQTNGAALQAMPTSIQWGIWPTGVFQVMKQAELNFGVTRDSVLNATNEYEIFTERFFELVFVGVREDPTDETSKPESALWVTSSLPQTGIEGATYNITDEIPVG